MDHLQRLFIKNLSIYIIGKIQFKPSDSEQKIQGIVKYAKLVAFVFYHHFEIELVIDILI